MDPERAFLRDETRQKRPNVLRRLFSPAVLAVFLVTIFYLGVTEDYASPFNVAVGPKVSTGLESVLGDNKKPDFGQYVKLRTVTQEEIAIEEPERRVIVVGDIHGMYDPFQTLLSKLGYHPKLDTLMHLGDILAKGPKSLKVLDWMSSRNITGVRGNHDQTVIEWRAYMDWVSSHKGGKEWLAELAGLDSQAYDDLTASMKKKYPVPKGWVWGSDHFNIARKMTQEQYDYLRSLPLVIHIPSMHTFLVHGGLLASNPKRPMHDKHQPLAHLPSEYDTHSDPSKTRTAQELAILTDIPQNADPFTLLNIRDITPKGKVSRKTGKGRPWTDAWNEVQRLCGGFGEARDVTEIEGMVQPESDDLKKKKLPCHPTAVFYGHSASRGLDVKRWSTGIDTGCIYGRRLTALVIGDSRHKGIDEAGDEEELEELRFGDSYKARLASVKCHKP